MNQETTKTFKNHPLMMISELGTKSVIILFILLNNIKIETLEFIYQSFQSGNLWTYISSHGTEGLIGIAILIGILAIFLFTTWRKWYLTTYELSASGLSVIKKGLNQNTLHLYKKDISNINRTQNLLQRICGIYKLSINTNTSDTASKTDVKIFLNDNDSLWLMTVLKEVSSSTQDLEDKNTILFEKSYSKWEVIRHTFLAMSWEQVFFFLGILFIFVSVKCLDKYFIITLPSFVLTLNNSLKGYLSLTVLLAGAAGLLFKFIKTYLKIANFTIKRSKDDILLSYGLLTKEEYILPLEKIHAIVLKQSFLARLFHLTSIDVINIGLNDEKKEESTLLLQGPTKEALKNLAILLPEYNIEDHTQKQDTKNIGIYILNALPYLSMITLLAYLFLDVPLFYLIFFYLLYRLFKCYLATKTASFSDSNNLLVLSNGDFDKTTYLILKNKIEQIDIRKSLSARIYHKGKAIIYIMSNKSSGLNITDFGYYDDKILAKFKTIITKKENA